jgi:integrase
MMARGSEKLSAAAVRNAKDPGLYGDGGNLYLRVGEGAAKSWVLRFMLNGRAREMGLGSAATFSLKEARERARRYRQLLADDIDPIDVRQQQRAARRTVAAKSMTFKQCAEAFIKAKAAEWKNAKHAAQWPATLEQYVYPVIGGLPVDAIDTALVMKAIEPIWQNKPETASRVRGRIESVLDWATARGYRTGENPARWRGHLENLLSRPSKAKAAVRRELGRDEHFAALPYAELPAFMAELRQHDGVAARALEFAILTCSRTGEAIGATWQEIDCAARLWCIPGERMKAGKEHRVPLAERAVAIIEQMAAIRESDHVFPGGWAGRPLGGKAMTEMLRRMGRGDLTVHGFRSSFSDWCAELTGFAAEVRKMALAHAVGDKVEAAYRRSDLFNKRRQLAEAWAKFCTSPPAAGAVVPLHRALQQA